MGLGAIWCKHGNGWRAWTLARYFDAAGSGWINKADFVDFLTGLGIHERTRRRWLIDALAAGLLFEDASRAGLVLRIAGLAAGALALDCERVGTPAIIPLEHLISDGWRAVLWDAFTATLPEGRPISQSTKRIVTQTPERTQRHYQAQVQGKSIQNYQETDIPADRLTGLKEYGDSGSKHFFKSRSGKAVQRLPNIVLPNVAQSTKKGRSKKAQKAINFLFQREQEKIGAGRVFFPTLERLERDTRRVIRDAERTGQREVFVHLRNLHTANLWGMVRL